MVVCPQKAAKPFADEVTGSSESSRSVRGPSDEEYPELDVPEPTSPSDMAPKSSDTDARDADGCQSRAPRGGKSQAKPVLGSNCRSGSVAFEDDLGQDEAPHRRDASDEVAVEVASPRPAYNRGYTRKMSGRSSIGQLSTFGGPTDWKKLARYHTQMTGLSYLVAPVWEEAFHDHVGPGISQPTRISLEKLEPECLQEVSCLDRLMLQPSSTKRLLWDFVGMLLILNDVIFAPLQFFSPPETVLDRVLSMIARLFWTFDMPLTFVTGYLMPDGTNEMRPLRVAQRYLRSWLLADIGILSCDWAEAVFGGTAMEMDGDGMKTLRIMRMLRLSRLVRVARMPALLKTVMEAVGAAEFVLTCDILKILAFFLGVTHLLACCWYGIGLLGFGGRGGWVDDHGLRHDDLGWRYTTSLHWSVTQFIGSMEVTPQNSLERIFALLVLVFAFVSSAFFVSSITSAMTRHHIAATRQTRQLATLWRYLQQNGFSQPLAVRVHRNARYALMEQQRNLPEMEVELLAAVSEPLRIELHFEFYSSELLEHPFFKYYIEHSPAVMRKICHVAFSVKMLSGGDVFFRTGEVPDTPAMYIIRRGALSYKINPRDEIPRLPGSFLVEETRPEDGTSDNEKHLGPGNFLCEGTLWTACWTHLGVLSTQTETQLLVLNAHIFQEVACQAAQSFNPQDYADAFVEYLNDASVQASDLGDKEVVRRLVHENYSYETMPQAASMRRESKRRRSTDSSISGTSATRSRGRNSGPSSSFRGSDIRNGKIVPFAHPFPVAEAPPSRWKFFKLF